MFDYFGWFWVRFVSPSLHLAPGMSLAQFWLPYGTFWLPSGSLLAPFWLPFGAVWRSFGAIWLPSGSFWVPFWLPFGSLLAPLGFLGVQGRAWIQFSMILPSKWRPFGCQNGVKISKKSIQESIKNLIADICFVSS